MTDTKELPENVTGHCMGPYVTHDEDGRMCGYHHRLGVWVCSTPIAYAVPRECTRTHPKHLRGM